MICSTCGRPLTRKFAGARIDGEPIAMVWRTCEHGHVTVAKYGASTIFAAFGSKQ